ncbi:hypothetical protein F5X68DRAFT_200263 [Plectosphaerella plurivora]|uniref:Uncharacterized protein n=1 Tax=Plectosphaerella plurivora TaxID=936078 RepID=A0A9P8VIH8_9PEZI|nr:hypothetical protein F5X68DRAFT_200263 [Plectosphaerella plurivora]
MARAILSAMPPQEPFPFSDPRAATDSVLRWLSIGFTSWLIIGALGYSNWSPPDDGVPLEMLLGGALVMAQVVSLIGVVDPAGATWPRSFGVYATSAILGAGVTTICAILLSKFAQHAYVGMFWSLSGIYLGMVVEGVTGIVHRARALMAATAESRVMDPRRV